MHRRKTVPKDGLIEFEGDLVSMTIRVVGTLEVRRGDGGRRNDVVEITLNHRGR